MPAHLDYLNKNLYRTFPLRSGSNMTTLEGVILPSALLTSASIAVTYAMSDVYVSNIYCNGNYINVTIRDNKTSTALGCFSGNVTQNYQVLSFIPFISGVSGTMTTGTVDAITNFRGGYTMDSTNGRIEDSLVFCYTPPAVTSLVHDATVTTGNIKLNGHNIAITTPSNVLLTVVNKSTLLSNNDFSSALGNCPTPIITHINTVPTDAYGNIDIYGITPVAISISNGNIVITPGSLTITDLCQAMNIRLAPNSTSNTYYTDILTTTTPEWKTW